MKIKGTDLKRVIKEEVEKISEDELGYEPGGAPPDPKTTEAAEILMRLQELADGVGLAMEDCVRSYIADLDHILRGSGQVDLKQ